MAAVFSQTFKKRADKERKPYHANSIGTSFMKAEPWHQVLGVQRNCTEEELKRAFRGLVRQFHPDLYPPEHADMVNEAVIKMTRINHAYKQGKAEIMAKNANNAQKGPDGSTGNRFRSRFEE